MGSNATVDERTTHDDDRGVVADALRTLEERFPRGVTSAQVVAFFQEQGVRLSEATFRRYVQLGFLPRCRRVGRKGRNRGSQGIYPVVVVRRLREVKRLLDEGLTIDEIRGLFRVREDDIQEIRDRLATIVEAVGAQLAEVPDERLARRLDELRELGAAIEAKLRQVAADVAHARQRAQIAV